MRYTSPQQRWVVEQKNKQRLLAVNPALNEKSGIYFLTRKDENGIKYAYIGQAKHILTRLAQHLVGYQHIDLSLKAHSLYSANTPYGWKIGFQNFAEDELDEKEQYFIREYANAGYQLRNKTAGGQGEGKKKINEYRSSKGYRDGLAQGRKNLARELLGIIEKHLQISLKPEKQGNKVSERQLEMFWGLLKDE